jgi:hypothetical protein
MESIRVALCENCEHCPAVEITEEGVRIGEEGNLVRLSHAQWNELVARVRRGELGPAQRSAEVG